MTASPSAPELQLLAPVPKGCEGILSDDALRFVAALQAKFGAERQALLRRRAERQKSFDDGNFPHFLPDTASLRAAEWTVAPIPSDLQRRWVEITGPVDRKMVINALNSGADVFMADFEDANSPTWVNVVHGQQNLADAVRRVISFADPSTGKQYALGEKTAVLFVRPRGWHLDEAHASLNGEPISASLFDFGLYAFHNATEAVSRGTGPYFYLPKLESHLEARLWADVFRFSETELGLARGTIRATVLIETLPAAFEMDEILWELREYSAGLNCGRWDYIFSYIKTFRAHASHVIPDRAAITMLQPFMRAYTQRVIQVCHRRGIHAMGGMAAQIPIKGDPAAHEAAMAAVARDKEREVTDGHDGTWVAHPGLVALARGVFAQHLGDRANQIERQRPDVSVGETDLLALPTGPRTEESLAHNIRVGVRYIASWLVGQGCVPLYNLMEDAATAEISRAQIWQWVHHRAQLDDGSTVTRERFRAVLARELAALSSAVGSESENEALQRAAELFATLVEAPELASFLTLSAYREVLASGN
jgi:malate synthase